MADGRAEQDLISPLISVSIFDDIFGEDDSELDEPTMPPATSSAAANESDEEDVYTAPLVVFNVSLGETLAQQIDIYMPATSNAAGRRVELFDATTNQLLARRDIASLGSAGNTLSFTNLPAGSELKVRISSLTGEGHIAAAARVS